MTPAGATHPGLVRWCARCSAHRVVDIRERPAVADDPESMVVLDAVCPCGSIIERRVRLDA